MIKRLFSRRWLPLTIIALVAFGVTVRLGIWQLDRLEQRRAFNARVNAQISQPELILDQAHIDADVANMEYREIVARGEYDHTQEIVVRNQHWQNQWGVHLVTPLIIDGSDTAILVDRGWIPAEDFESGDWSKFDEPGFVEVSGVVRASKAVADFGGRTDQAPVPGSGRVEAWNFVNVDAISKQTSVMLLPAYIQAGPDGTQDQPPYRSLPELELTEGPHQGYAIQWFTFAAIAAIGYPIYVYQREKKPRNVRNSNTKIQVEGFHDQT